MGEEAKSDMDEALLRTLAGAREGDVLIDPRPEFATLSLGILPPGAVVEFEKTSWDGRTGETTASFRIRYPQPGEDGG